MSSIFVQDLASAHHKVVKCRVSQGLKAQMGSAYFKVSWVEMLIAWLEIFHSSHFGKHFSKQFLGRLVFYCSCLPANTSWYQPSGASWCFNNGAFLVPVRWIVLLPTDLPEAFWLICEDYQNRSSCESHIYGTRDHGYGLRGKLAFKLSTEHFRVWHKEFICQFNKSINCLHLHRRVQN